ncbi:MAG: hypothetical protein H7066_14275 [Cytophagaceae bacterium]|nr:hypothetical protein [Gemmatimonadaceae bacterium]
MTRRLASLATLLFFAQLSLVGGVARCWQAATGTHTTHTASPSGHDGNHGESASHDADTGDSLPGCTATSMCVVVMMAPIASDVALRAIPERTRIAAAPTAPLSITQAPELPPPRG